MHISEYDVTRSYSSCVYDHGAVKLRAETAADVFMSALRQSNKPPPPAGLLEFINIGNIDGSYEFICF